MIFEEQLVSVVRLVQIRYLYVEESVDLLDFWTDHISKKRKFEICYSVDFRIVYK